MSEDQKNLFSDLSDLILHISTYYNESKMINPNKMFLFQILNEILKRYKLRYYKSELDNIHFLKSLFLNLDQFHDIFKKINKRSYKHRSSIKWIKNIDLLVQFISCLKITMLFSDFGDISIYEDREEAFEKYRDLFKNMFNDPCVKILDISESLSKCKIETNIGAFIYALIIENKFNCIKENGITIFDLRSKDECKFLKIEKVEKLDNDIISIFLEKMFVSSKNFEKSNNTNNLSDNEFEIIEKFIKNRIIEKYTSSLNETGISIDFCTQVFNNYELDQLYNFGAFKLLMDYCKNDKEILKMNDELDYDGIKIKIGASGYIDELLTQEEDEYGNYCFSGGIDYPLGIIESLSERFYLSNGILSDMFKKPFVLSTSEELNFLSELNTHGIVINDI